MKVRDGKVTAFSAVDGHLAVSSQVGANSFRIQIFDASGTVRSQLSCVKSSYPLGLSWVNDGRVLLCVLSNGRILEYCNVARKYIASHSLVLKKKHLDICTCTPLKTGFIVTTGASVIIFVEYKYRHLVVRKIDLSEYVVRIMQLEVTQRHGGGCYIQSNNALCLFSGNKMYPCEIRLISSFAVAPSGYLVSALTRLHELCIFSSDLHTCTFRCVLDCVAGTVTSLLQWHTSNFLLLFLSEEIILLKVSTDCTTKCSQSIKHPWYDMLEQLHWWRNGAHVCLPHAQHSHTKWVSSCEIFQYMFDINHIDLSVDLSVVDSLRTSISIFEKFYQDIPNSFSIHGFTSDVPTQASEQHSFRRRRQLSGFLRASGKMYSGLKICPDVFKGLYIMDWYINFVDSFATQQSPTVAAQILDKIPPLILDENALRSSRKPVQNVRPMSTHQILQFALVQRDSGALFSILSALQDENDVYIVMKFLSSVHANRAQICTSSLNKHYRKYVLNAETLDVKFDVVETQLLAECAARDWRAASFLEDSNARSNILKLLSARMEE